MTLIFSFLLLFSFFPISFICPSSVLDTGRDAVEERERKEKEEIRGENAMACGEVHSRSGLGPFFFFFAVHSSRHLCQ